MKRPALLLITTFFLTFVSSGQVDRAWAKMSKQNADRILNESAWGQTQTDTDVSELFYSPTKSGTSTIGASPAAKGKITDQQAINNNRSDRGATNEAVYINYRV